LRKCVGAHPRGVHRPRDSSVDSSGSAVRNLSTVCARETDTTAHGLDGWDVQKAVQSINNDVSRAHLVQRYYYLQEQRGRELSTRAPRKWFCSVCVALFALLQGQIVPGKERDLAPRVVPAMSSRKNCCLKRKQQRSVPSEVNASHAIGTTVSRLHQPRSSSG
jgi:hypothetical protein